MSDLNLVCVPGTVSNFSNVDGVLQFSLQHVTERNKPADGTPAPAPTVSDFSVICKNPQMVKWVESNGPLNDGDTVMVFATRLKELRDEDGPWLALYTDNFVILDPDSPLLVFGQIEGNVGSDSEMSFIGNNGTPKTRASIALEWSERNATNSGWLKETTWAYADIFGKPGDDDSGNAARAQRMMTKGARIKMTVRELHTRTYLAKDGSGLRLSIDFTGGIFRAVNAPKQQQQPTTETAGVRRPGAAPVVAAPQSVVAMAMAAAANGVVSNVAASDVPF